MTTEINASDYSQAYESGKKQVQLLKIGYGASQVAIVPKDMQAIDLTPFENEFLEAPRRFKQRVVLNSIESFIDYVKRYANPQSTIFFDSESGNFLAILDWHPDANSPSFLNHKAAYNAPKTKEWISWLSKNDSEMNQEDFAYFIEENAKQILEPNAKDMLDIASTLKATVNLQFKSGIRLDNGEVKFQYEQTIDGKAGSQSDLSIPQTIKLAIKPFLNSAPYEIEAKFRYRIQHGGLKLRYTIIAPHLSLQDAVSDMVTLVKSELANVNIYEGKAE